MVYIVAPSCKPFVTTFPNEKQHSHGVTNFTIQYRTRNMQLFAFAHLKSSVSRGSDLSSRLCFLALRRQGSNESTNSLPNTRTTILRNNDQTNLDSAFIRLLDFCLNLGGGGLSLSASLCLAYLSESAYHERICLYARADPRYLNSPLILLLTLSPCSRSPP